MSPSAATDLEAPIEVDHAAAVSAEMVCGRRTKMAAAVTWLCALGFLVAFTWATVTDDDTWFTYTATMTLLFVAAGTVASLLLVRKKRIFDAYVVEHSVPLN